jgi:hypothetical protein
MEDVLATLNECKRDLVTEAKEAKAQYEDVTSLCTSSQAEHEANIKEAK